MKSKHQFLTTVALKTDTNLHKVSMQKCQTEQTLPSKSTSNSGATRVVNHKAARETNHRFIKSWKSIVKLLVVYFFLVLCHYLFVLIVVVVCYWWQLIWQKKKTMNNVYISNAHHPHWLTMQKWEPSYKNTNRNEINNTLLNTLRSNHLNIIFSSAVVQSYSCINHCLIGWAKWEPVAHILQFLGLRFSARHTVWGLVSHWWLQMERQAALWHTLASYIFLTQAPKPISAKINSWKWAWLLKIYFACVVSEIQAAVYH